MLKQFLFFFYLYLNYVSFVLTLYITSDIKHILIATGQNRLIANDAQTDMISGERRAVTAYQTLTKHMVNFVKCSQV